METRTAGIPIREEDLNQLRSMLLGGGGSADHIRTLRSRLEEAAIVAAVPQDVITLGTTFRMRDLETQVSAEYTLVLPHMADVKRGHISVLAPIGSLLLGAHESETITFSTPTSSRQFLIEQILKQPNE